MIDWQELTDGLTTTQINFIIARMSTTNDKAAAETIGITPDAVYHWHNLDQVRKVLRQLALDCLYTLSEINTMYRSKDTLEASAQVIKSLQIKYLEELGKLTPKYGKRS